MPDSSFSWGDACPAPAARPPQAAASLVCGDAQAGADGAAHTSPALLQREDAAAAAGAWEEGEDEEPAL